jgi:hypothetical protein
VSASELEELAHEHIHRGRSRTIAYLCFVLVGHPHRLVVDCKQILLVNELRGQLG